VLLGVAGAWLGFPLADPIVGAVISLVIFRLLVQTSRDVLVRVIDGMERTTLRDIERAAASVPGIQHCARVRARWSGHRIYADLSLVVSERLTVAEALHVREDVASAVQKAVPELADVVIQWQSTR
jgi:divalent metal cation (Fe/Co/Zn/Cd) transporter